MDPKLWRCIIFASKIAHLSNFFSENLWISLVRFIHAYWHGKKTKSDINVLMKYSGFNNWHTSRMYLHLHLLIYTWFWTCIHWHVRLSFPYDFLKFSKFFWFINLLIYIWPSICLFVCGRDRFFIVYIYFKETLFFNFSYELFNISPYLRALASLGC